MQKLVNGHRCSVAVEVVSEPEICHGAGFKLADGVQMRAMSGFSVHYQFVLSSRSKSKNRDKQLTFIVRVRRRYFFKSSKDILSKNKMNISF